MAKVIEIKTSPLHEWQRDLIKLYDENKKNSIITVLAQRQVGKSYALMILALRECINNPYFTTIILTPSYTLGRKFFNDLSKAIKGLPNIRNCNSSYFEITFTNGSVIKIRSSEQKQNLRGETCSLLIIDESAFIPLEVGLETFNYTNSTNGSIILSSTPKFKDENNLFYKFYKSAIEGQEGCYLIDFTKYDTSAMLDEKKKELFKKTMPFNIYQNEVLGQFLEEKSSVFGDFGKVISNYVHPYTQCYAGIDFATGVNADETAVAIFNENKKMVGLFHFNDVDTNETVVKVINILQSNKVNKAVIETNSIGRVFFDLMKEKINLYNLRTQLIPFTTTNQSKREIIQNLQLHIQNETITLLDDMTLKLQLANFEIKSTPSGLITYGNSSDTIHDDTVIATALALHAFKSGGYAVR